MPLYKLVYTTYTVRKKSLTDKIFGYEDWKFNSDTNSYVTEADTFAQAQKKVIRHLRGKKRFCKKPELCEFKELSATYVS
jgi:hypothetical protein